MVEKNVKKCENVMIFVIFVIFNRGLLCQDIGKMSLNFGISVFFMLYKRNITQRSKFSEKQISVHPNV